MIFFTTCRTDEDFFIKAKSVFGSRVDGTGRELRSKESTSRVGEFSTITVTIKKIEGSGGIGVIFSEESGLYLLFGFWVKVFGGKPIFWEGITGKAI